MTDLTTLSPTAQAVMDAVHGIMPYTSIAEVLAIAAALRAAVEVAVPEEPLHGGDQRWMLERCDRQGWMLERDARQACRKKLLAIATELEGSND